MTRHSAERFDVEESGVFWMKEMIFVVPLNGDVD
jgi:hypothetical protein